MKLLQMQLEKWSGQYGRLGVSQGWCLDVILLDVFFLGVDSPHQKVQSCSGKYVHVMQFWRPLFGLIEKLWSRVGKFIVSCQVRHGERRQSVGVGQTTPPCKTGAGAWDPGSISHRPLVGGADRPKGRESRRTGVRRSGGCRRSFHFSAANLLLGHVEDTLK